MWACQWRCCANHVRKGKFARNTEGCFFSSMFLSCTFPRKERKKNLEVGHKCRSWYQGPCWTMLWKATLKMLHRRCLAAQQRMAFVPGVALRIFWNDAHILANSYHPFLHNSRLDHSQYLTSPFSPSQSRNHRSSHWCNQYVQMACSSISDPHNHLQAFFSIS